jgi:SAM-dependent methyltransferase
MQKRIAIDEDGYFLLENEIRLSDNSYGHSLLSNLRIDEHFALWTESDGEAIVVEPFDKPLVVQNISPFDHHILLDFAYGFSLPLRLETLCIDDWGRFHGLTHDKIPFVFTRKGQAAFLQLVTVKSENSFEYLNKSYSFSPYYLASEDAGKLAFWSEHYENTATPPWDLDGPHPALAPILPQIKLLKSRILNLGCGRGHDAHFLAQKGHIVTGVDISSAAIEQAKALYKKPANLYFYEDDVFHSTYKTDIIFEHTLFCAIPPNKRKDLVKVWKNSLEETGYLLGIFFVMPKRTGPPYGCSEWELRELLEPHFRLMYWKRWELSPPRREGTELVVFAQKR